MLKTTGIDTDAIRFGNPTCKYCGVTYPMIERHDCVFGQEARMKILQEKHDALERAVKIARSTLRDQFAMAALTGILAREGNTVELAFTPYAEFAYKHAAAMMEVRKLSAE